MEEQKSVGEWDNYCKNFLKAADVTSEDQVFVVISLEEVQSMENERQIRLHLESNQKKYIFDLNKTNTVFLKGKLASPRDAVGKKICFKKVETTNPRTKLPTEGLRFLNVE
jgi:hypothetical protein